jgi:hypothetical protein
MNKRRTSAYIEDVDGLRQFNILNNFAPLTNGRHAYPAIIMVAGEVVTNETCFALSSS